MKRKVWISLSAVIVVLGVLIWLIWRQLNAPAVGHINNAVQSEDAKPGPSWILLTGKAFSVEYLGNYSSRPTGVPGDDKYFFVGDGGNGAVTKHLAIAVDTLNGHGLEDEPSYKSRKIDTATYKLDIRRVGTLSIPVMSKLDGMEQVAYLVKGNTIATIALTAPDTNGDLTAELAHMLATWTWK